MGPRRAQRRTRRSHTSVSVSPQTFATRRASAGPSKNTHRLALSVALTRTARTVSSVSQDAACSALKVRSSLLSRLFLSSLSLFFGGVGVALSLLFGPVYSRFCAGREFSDKGLVCVDGVLRATDSWKALLRQPALQCVVALCGIAFVRLALAFAGPVKQLVCAAWQRRVGSKAAKSRKRGAAKQQQQQRQQRGETRQRVELMRRSVAFSSPRGG